MVVHQSFFRCGAPGCGGRDSSRSLLTASAAFVLFARRGKRGAGVGASDADANDASWGVCSSRRRTDRSTDSRALIRPLKRKPNPIHRTEPRRGKDDARDDEQDDAGRDTDGDANEREDDACERANACGEAGAGEPVV